MHSVTFYPSSLHQQFAYSQECSQHTDTWNNYKINKKQNKESEFSFINCPNGKRHPTVCHLSSSAAPQGSGLPSWLHPPPELQTQLDSELGASVKDRKRNTNMSVIGALPNPRPMEGEAKMSSSPIGGNCRIGNRDA